MCNENRTDSDVFTYLQKLGWSEPSGTRRVAFSRNEKQINPIKSIKTKANLLECSLLLRSRDKRQQLARFVSYSEMVSIVVVARGHQNVHLSFYGMANQHSSVVVPFHRIVKTTKDAARI